MYVSEEKFEGFENSITVKIKEDDRPEEVRTLYYKVRPFVINMLKHLSSFYNMVIYSEFET